MMSSITSDSGAPVGMRGIRKSCTTVLTGGCTMNTSGINSRLPATSTMEKRSKRRKSPVLAAAMTSTAAQITPTTLGKPR